MSSDRITLTGLRVRGFHGVLPRSASGPGLPRRRRAAPRPAAAASSTTWPTPSTTASWRHGWRRRRGEPVDLIETLAARLADVCLSYALVERAEVTVHKPRRRSRWTSPTSA
jgi:hypothetical protein